MVNPDSPTFKISEKIGLIIGTAIRYALFGSAIVLLGGLIKNINPSYSAPNRPPSNPLSSY